MKLSFLLLLFLCVFSLKGQNTTAGIADRATYLRDLKTELQKEWPKNRTINIVFHGHSVPAGYFKTPQVNTLNAYPQQFLRKLKETYPFATVNVIVTAIGGENSLSGEKRFKNFESEPAPGDKSAYFRRQD